MESQSEDQAVKPSEIGIWKTKTRKIESDKPDKRNSSNNEKKLA